MHLSNYWISTIQLEDVPNIVISKPVHSLKFNIIFTRLAQEICLQRNTDFSDISHNLQYMKSTILLKHWKALANISTRHSHQKMTS